MTPQERIEKLEQMLLNLIETDESKGDWCYQDERAFLKAPCHRCACGLKERLASE